jgi:L-fuconolactonase
MFGSDWPVCLLVCGYRRWHDIVRDFASKLTLTEQNRLFGETAIEAYGLK